jgi:hypothetical protein
VTSAEDLLTRVREGLGRICVQRRVTPGAVSIPLTETSHGAVTDTVGTAVSVLLFVLPVLVSAVNSHPHSGHQLVCKSL